jgi:hypothetical protein
MKLGTKIIGVVVCYLSIAPWSNAAEPGLRFEVGIAPALVTTPPAAGRVMLVLAKPDRRAGRRGDEPRFAIGQTGREAPPFLGADVGAFKANHVAVLDGRSAIFPLANLRDLPAGEYAVQAVFHSNRDLNLHDAPGNLVSEPQRVTLDPAKAVTVKLTLTRRLADEQLPKDSATHKYLRFPSKVLTAFHGRPMVYRAAVVLPPNFADEPDKRYLLRVHIGGFGTRYTFARGLRPDPRFVQVLLDGAGPYGDPYQVNSANNGPYGDALTQELLPHIEATYRCGGPGRRFTDGGSTGGWVSLALQVFYPDYFNGCWSSCPDPVDFRCYELINIYEDANAYVNRFGFERPAKRTLDGEMIYSVRHECQIENVLGRGDNWALGGKDWASWNATYGPRGENGQPIPLWDPKTGIINRKAAEQWKKYDLRFVLEQNWASLGPKLTGKMHVWVGDADDYFLNNAVHRLRDSLGKRTNPSFNGEVTIAPRRGHTSGWSSTQILDAMDKRATP